MLIQKVHRFYFQYHCGFEYALPHKMTLRFEFWLLSHLLPFSMRCLNYGNEMFVKREKVEEYRTTTKTLPFFAIAIVENGTTPSNIQHRRRRQWHACSPPCRTSTPSATFLFSDSFQRCKTKTFKRNPMKRKKKVPSARPWYISFFIIATRVDIQSIYPPIALPPGKAAQQTRLTQEPQTAEEADE